MKIRNWIYIVLVLSIGCDLVTRDGHFPGISSLEKRRFINPKDSTEYVSMKYTPDGVLYDSVLMKHCKREGLRYDLDTIEHIYYFSNYKNGICNGPIYGFYENDSLYFVGTMRNGKRVNDFEYYLKDGALSEYRFYLSNGELSYRCTYDQFKHVKECYGYAIQQDRTDFDSIQTNQTYKGEFDFVEPPYCSSELVKIHAIHTDASVVITDTIKRTFFKVMRFSYRTNKAENDTITFSWLIRNSSQEVVDTGNGSIPIRVVPFIP